VCKCGYKCVCVFFYGAFGYVLVSKHLETLCEIEINSICFFGGGSVEFAVR